MSWNSAVNQSLPLEPLVLHWPKPLRVADDCFFDFCQVNRDLRIERTAEGNCEIMAPTGGGTSWRNSALVAQCYNWAEKEGNGVVFDSSGGFILPNGAIRSPDVSWVKRTKLAALTPEQKQRFLPLCPDFVIELRSPSDSLNVLQDKMQEYMSNGVSLGWLIDPSARQVYVFQPNQLMICLDNPDVLTAGNLLKNFELDLLKIWDVGF